MGGGRFKQKKIRKRLGSRKKKGFESKANQFISRSRATSKLQVSLPVFRKLCILKGIYPQDPKMKHRKSGANKVYYHVRDIKHLRREPLLWKYREMQTHKNKMTRHKGRHDWDKVKSMGKQKPVVRVDHLIRERYPHFNDALRDLDDCLCIVHLFGSLPSGKIKALSYDRRIHCANLIKQWMYYVISKNILRKAFVSVKGIYYEIVINNRFKCVYLVPHEFAQHMPSDVDYRVMSTFLEFYETMLQFVLVRLYKLGQMDYPPFEITETSAATHSLTKLILNNNNNKTSNSSKQNNNDSESSLKDEISAVTLDVSQIKGINVSSVTNNHKTDSSMSDDLTNDDIVVQKKKKQRDRSNLFEGFVFLINRECPQISLEFVILSLKGKVHFVQRFDESRDGKMITHQIIDRPIHDSDMKHSRSYVQPQWIYDCLNVGIVVPAEHYGPNMQCPPHLSPFTEEMKTDDPLSSAPVQTTQELVIQHWKELAESYGGFVPTAQKLGATVTTTTNQSDDEQTKSASFEDIIADIPINSNSHKDEMDDAMVDSEMLTATKDDNVSDVDHNDDQSDNDSNEETDGNIDDFLAAEAPDYSEWKGTNETIGDTHSTIASKRVIDSAKDGPSLSKQDRLDIERVEIAQSMRKRLRKTRDGNDIDDELPDVSNNSLSEQIKEAKLKAKRDRTERESLAKAMMPNRHRRLYEKMMFKSQKKNRKHDFMKRRNQEYEQKILNKKQKNKNQ